MLKRLIPLALLVAPAAQADLALSFDEGAPKDRFTLTNSGVCALPAGDVTIDLSTAAGGLIFDVTSSGAGVEVFQPFEMIAGADRLSAMPRVQDGDSAITLRMSGLGIGESIAFTIDVDDTGGAREITVNGAEIAGATLRATIGGVAREAVINDRARARLAVPACTS